MNNHQKEALFGTTASHAEHREGDVIQYRDLSLGIIKRGKILHVRAPAPSPVSGRDLPLLYMVDTNEGMPVLIEPAMIIEGPFTACIGSYGFPDSALVSREQAENLSVNVIGQIIDSAEQGRLRVLTARIEGDERQGRAIAECEAVGSEESH